MIWRAVVRALNVGQRVVMKSITLRELHEQTEAVVLRVAAEDGYIITRQGEPIAILKAASTGSAAPRKVSPSAQT